jgi:hypothetical protein
MWKYCHTEGWRQKKTFEYLGIQEGCEIRAHDTSSLIWSYIFIVPYFPTFPENLEFIMGYVSDTDMWHLLFIALCKMWHWSEINIPNEYMYSDWHDPR